MKIQNMFQKDVNRPINGVIKVMQTDEENRRQELEEYVITRELQKHFGAFYDHYEQSIGSETDKMGVWISGFFGSGKSHFLKILSYLLQNDVVAGKPAIEYFRDKFSYDPLRYEMMRRVSRSPAETILFNIDAKAPMGKDQNAILRVFAKVFYEHCGYYGDDLKVAAFERFLDRRGRLNEFKAAFERINGEAWVSARDAFAFWEDDVVQALMEVERVSEQAARNWFNGEETAELSIDRLAREICEYVSARGGDFRLIFLADEIGQYIGDDSSLMLNLQTLVEELGAKGRGRVWVIVTSQEDIDSVTHVKGNDFSKIQGRFNTRLSLSSASVDEVIKKRVLAKNEDAAALLHLLYQQNASGMRNLFSFSQGTIADLKGYSSEEEFVEAYPFVPYQFRLLQEVLMQVRKHGSSGKHLSGGERSMLSAFQEAAQHEQARDERAFVPFYDFYDTIHTFLDGAIRRVIDRAAVAAERGDGLEAGDVDVLKLLFLVRYVEGLAPNIENLSTLMIADAAADKIILRRTLQQSLDRLTHENYASRSGESYLFLTDEEQDINREIRATAIDSSELTHKIGELVFGDIYAARKFRYKNRYDFAFDPMVDNAAVGQLQHDIRLRVVTLASELSESDADGSLALQSSAGNEAIVLLDPEVNYYLEIEEALKIDRYVKQRNISQLPESIRKIVQGKQAEAREREKNALNLLRRAIAGGRFYVCGERVSIRAAGAKEALDQAMTALVEAVYSKLNCVTSFVQSEADIQKILAEPAAQEEMSGVARPNAAALELISQYMEISARRHMPVTVADIQRRYQAAPYGWRELDISALIASLARAQKLQLVSGGAVIPLTERRALDSLRRRSEMEKTLVRQRVCASEQLLRGARQLAGELFATMDLKRDEENLCGQIAELLGDLKRRCDALLSQYGGSVAYPGREAVAQGQELCAATLNKRGDNVAFLTAFNERGDALLDWREDFEPVEFFFKNQAGIFRDAWKLYEKAKQERDYFADEPQAREALRAMGEILRDASPYRRIAQLPELRQAVNLAYERINAARREKVAEVIAQARGDIRTLSSGQAQLRDELAKIEAELDRRAQAAGAAESPVQLDALITQILTYKDAECRRIEGIIANKCNAQREDTRKLRIRTIRRYDIMPQKRISSAAEIDAYVEQLRRALADALQGNDAIQLN